MRIFEFREKLNHLTTRALSFFDRLVLLACTALLTTAVAAQEKPYVPGEFIVRFYPDAQPGAVLEEMANLWGSQVQSTPLSRSSHIFKLSTNGTVFELSDEGRGLLDDLRDHPSVDVAQFNHYISAREVLPNDPGIDQQWHHANGGDHDIDSDLAWETTTGGNTANGDDVVVCVIEGGGTYYSHTDLIDNHWTNPGEIPGNGIDDDENGFVDDYNGWNATSDDDNIPGGNHGTGVSGMIGAKGNNELGGSGVNWDVKLMQVVIGALTEDNVISAYNYPLVMRQLYNSTGGDKGALVVATNASWGIDFANPDNYPVWCGFYDDLGAAGILNCGATANNNVNVDNVGDMPTGCSSPYMIAVTATNSADVRTFSGYGQTSIDLGAPGESVYLPSGTWVYGNTSGTSFASPAVAGAIALLYSAPCASFANLALNDPQTAADLVRQYLFDGVDAVPGLATETATGGRLNVNNALQLLQGDCGPLPTCDILDLSATADCVFNPVSGQVESQVTLTVSFAHTSCDVAELCVDDDSTLTCDALESNAWDWFAPEYTLTGLNSGAALTFTATTADGQTASVSITTADCSGFVPGCTDTEAVNYDAAANFEDGSCVYPCSQVTLALSTDCWGGETGLTLTHESGEVALSVPTGSLLSLTDYSWPLCLPDGCYTLTLTDSYGDGLAGTIFGCSNDGSFGADYDAGVSIAALDTPNFGTSISWEFCVNFGEIPGCTDPAACNYTPGADTDDGTCQVPGGPCDDGLDTTGNDTVQADCTCAGLELGCTDETACNYVATALLDDGTCTYPGCTDPVGTNYDPTAGCDGESCTYNCDTFNLSLTTDCWGEEVFWNFVDADGTVLYSSNAGDYDDLTTYSIPVCLNPGCYTFTIFDSFGDGMSGVASGCEQDGFYDLTDAEGNVLISLLAPNAAYGDMEQQTFCLASDCLGDFDGDNWRLVPDLLLLVGNYSCMGDCGITDLNGDSSVDSADLLTFLGFFGTSCE